MTAAAIKAVDPSLQVGGPATAQLLWLTDFLAWARAGGVPVDFGALVAGGWPERAMLAPPSPICVAGSHELPLTCD